MERFVDHSGGKSAVVPVEFGKFGLNCNIVYLPGFVAGLTCKDEVGHHDERRSRITFSSG